MRTKDERAVSLNYKYLIGYPERNVMYNDGEMVQWWEYYTEEDLIYVDVYQATMDEVHFMPFNFKDLENIVFEINDEI